MQNDFNNKYCERTTLFTIQLVKTVDWVQGREATRVIIPSIMKLPNSLKNFLQHGRDSGKINNSPARELISSSAHQLLFSLCAPGRAFCRHRLRPWQAEYSIRRQSGRRREFRHYRPDSHPG